MISVIIPIYNTAQYLNRCIKSILKSSCTDFELLLINDGSTDASGRICRRYCREDGRVRYFEQEHKGVSAARNKGLDESRGNWIVFVDSDDCISENFLADIMQEECQYRELLIFEFSYLGKGKRAGAEWQCKWSDKPYGKIYQKKDILRLIESLLNMKPLTGSSNTSLPSPCAKAYRKSVIDQYHLRFPSDIVIGEDRLFNINYFLHISSCIYIRKNAYYVALRPDSAMRGFNPDFLQNDVKYQRKLRILLERHNLLPLLEKSYYNNVLSSIADILVRSLFNPNSTRTCRETCRLCEQMLKNPIYKQALNYSEKTGVLPRRILMFFFKRKCYFIVRAICRVSYQILVKTKKL